MFVANAAQAMEVSKFDKMDGYDQGTYIQLMADSAEKLLQKEGRVDLAEKVFHLFDVVPPHADRPDGLAEFDSNLAQVRIADAKNYAQDHNAKRLEAEQAMLITLAMNGISFLKHDLAAFLDVGKDFQPRRPPYTPPPQ